MKVGIDISQLAYPGTGVANYLESLLQKLIEDKNNEYVLFFSSLRGKLPTTTTKLLTNHQNVTIKRFKLPPTALNLLWNKMHVMPIEWFIGNIDIFITSDWTEPPTKKARKATILYDLIVYKYPEETAESIVKTQKMKLRWVKKESKRVFCISKATKNDAMELLGISSDKLDVIYPGITL